MDQAELFKGDLKLFIPITKVDEEKRLVFGRVTEETVDSSGEIFDYETSKPFYQDWIGYFQKATDGKSSGNLRVMHDAKKAVGTLPQVNLLDKEKAVEVIAKISDDDEWKKTLEGVYTGFSQGGRYVKKWYDGKGYRYTAQPNEISLVDYPALKSATFSLVKSDGVVEERQFKKVAEREDVNPERGKKEYGDVTFADEKNKKYPIDTETHIRAAWNYINKPKNAGKYSAEDVKSIKSKIISAWKKKIDKEGPPSASEDDEKADDFNEISILIEDFDEMKKYEKGEDMEEKKEDLEKGHSKETLSKIQGIHDHSVGLGAKCNKEAADAAGDLAKIQGEKDEALKKVSALETENADLKKKIEELEKQPQPPKGVTKDVVISKEQDSAEKERLEKESKDPMAAIRKVHQQPIIYPLHRPLS